MDKKELLEKIFELHNENVVKYKQSERGSYVANYYLGLGLGICIVKELAEQLDEPKFCEIKTVYKKDKITEKHCDDCDGHCDCSYCEHKDNPYYTYETEVFDYNLCTSCNYRYGVFESTNNFCPSCGSKIIKSE